MAKQSIDKRAVSATMMAAVHARVATMTESEKEARVQEIYDIPSDKITETESAEFFAIMFGGVSAS